MVSSSLRSLYQSSSGETTQEQPQSKFLTRMGTEVQFQVYWGEGGLKGLSRKIADQAALKYQSI